MSDAQTLTKALRGRWYRRYGVAFCPAHHNTRTPALSLSDGADGRLLARCHAGCGFEAILDALRGLGLLEGRGSFAAPDPFEAARRRAEEAALAQKRSMQARGVWDEALPIAQTIAAYYLRDRGITCDLPETLRFHPECWHQAGKRLPAMVGRVDGGDGFAVHRTYLLPDGSGKADVAPPKAMLGAVQGGAVRLSGGASRLVVAEGIETALSLLCGLLDGPATVWAALSTSGLRGLRLPPEPSQLTVAPDGDEAGRTAAVELADRAHTLGWEVTLAEPPPGLDWNDVLRQQEVPL